jgi:hypothetical protein
MHDVIVYHVKIGLTGCGRPQNGQTALTAGFSAHLGKPVDMKKLRELPLKPTGGRA